MYLQIERTWSDRQAQWSLAESNISTTRLESSEDSIQWRWTQNGEYTTKSVYQIQFEFLKKKKTNPVWKDLWEAKTTANLESTNGT